MRSKCCVIVVIASQNGRTKITSSAMVITATASPRLCQSRSWTCSMIGQVATTRVVAQITAGRNGHKIQKEAAISPPTKRTARVVRVSSEWAFHAARTSGVPLGGEDSGAHHQLQAMAVGVAEINAAVLSRTAADGNAGLLQLGLQSLVTSRRHIQRQVVEVIACRQRRIALLFEQCDALVAGMHKDLPVLLPI